MTSVDQKLATVARLIADQPNRFALQGTVVATWRTIAGRRCGPYYSLRYRDGVRQRSFYLGRSAELAAAVRRLLDGRQRTCREHVAIQRARAAIKASLREHKRLWQHHLEQAGLTLKGYQIHGWKQFHGDSAGIPHVPLVAPGGSPVAEPPGPINDSNWVARPESAKGVVRRESSLIPRPSQSL